MREIKFRVWDKKQRHMAIQGTPDIETLGGFAFHWFDDEELAKGDLILMQYTGLKDQNGKEIYEGDILEQDGAKIVIKSEDWVEFYAECLDEYHPNWCEDWIRDFYRISRFTIVGNILENPELVEK
jgi:uncharacterized phage protein (TIGR01671 family)